MGDAVTNVPFPNATGSIDAAELKERIKGNEAAIQSVYQAIGNATLRPAGKHHLKVMDGGKNPALNINKETGDWKDHRSGEHGDIIAAVMNAQGSTFQDALAFIDSIVGGRAPIPISQPAESKQAAQESSVRSRTIATYVYNDVDGSPYMAVDRTEDKQFFQKRANGQGGWTFGLNGLPPIPYHRDEFPEPGSGKLLVHCEGEKDADAARARGFNATTSPGGSKNWRDNLKPHYAGQVVAVIADNDEPGHAYAHAVASSLQGVAASVKVIDLPGLGERTPNGGKDLSDWFDLDKANNAISLKALIDAAPEWRGVEPDAVEEREPRFRLLTPNDLANRPSPRWQIEGVLVESSMSAIVGPPAAMKSITALDMAMSIGSGQPWHDRNVLSGPVVYISAEGSSGLPARIRAWEIHHARTAPEALYFITDAPQLIEQGDVHELLYSISLLPESPVMIVVDTLARTMVGGEENSAKDMGMFVAGLDVLRRETGAHIMVVHHEGKSGDMRGSTALRGALDTEISIKRDDNVITLTCKKQKDAAEFDRIVMVQRVIDLGNGQSSIVLEPLEFTSGTMSGIEQKVLNVLVEVFGRAGTTTTNWKLACEESGITHTPFYKARKNLVERGLVSSSDEAQRGAIFTPVFIEEEYQSEFAS